MADVIAHRAGKEKRLLLDDAVTVTQAKRIFPAIDIAKSGTRKEDLLVKPENLKKMFVLRRILNPMGSQDAIEFLIGKLKSTKTNGEFFDSMNT